MKKHYHYIEISKKGDDDRKLSRLQTSESSSVNDHQRLKAEYPEYDVRYVVSSEKEKVFNRLPVKA